MLEKETTDAVFALKMLMEKYRKGQRELHCVLVDLEKAYDRVSREKEEEEKNFFGLSHKANKKHTNTKKYIRINELNLG